MRTGTGFQAFHVSDAEFNPGGRQGPAGSYEPAARRVARLRAPGDGKVDFATVFSKLSEVPFGGWAVL